jgi:hypothetical protein
MNVDTKEVYWDREALMQAEARGERLLPLIKIGGAPKPRYSSRDYDAQGRLLPRHERRRLAKERTT